MIDVPHKGQPEFDMGEVYALTNSTSSFSDISNRTGFQNAVDTGAVTTDTHSLYIESTQEK